jgi:drug/metabolite transporter (DMT)-like permease
MASLSLPLPATDQVRRGILVALVAFAMFTVTDVVIKLLIGSYHTFQVAFFQALFSLLTMLVYTAWRGGLPRLRTRRLHLHLLRGVASIITVNSGYVAFAHLPIADAYAILFTTPLLVTALAVPLLGETVGWRRSCAVAVGFAGVLVMLRPGVAALGIGSAAALVAALGNAIIVILLRRMQGTETTESFGVYGNLCTTLGMLPTVFFVFAPPTLVDLGLSMVGGMLGSTAFILMIHAYRAAPASIIVPFQYSQMPYGLLLGFLLFGDRPAATMLIGAAIVAGSGLYILHRETRRRAHLVAG